MILIDKDNVVVDISNNIEDVDNYYKVNKNNEDYFYMKANLAIVDVETTEDIEPQKHKYINGDFVLNENYVGIS